MHSQLKEIPAIWVSVAKANTKQTDQIFWGIEEEGIPFKTTNVEFTDIKEAAYKAASLSPLAVGIACSDQEIVVHSRNLSPNQPLFHISLHEHSTQQNIQLRHLGSNAARLVKGLPFKTL